MKKNVIKRAWIKEEFNTIEEANERIEELLEDCMVEIENISEIEKDETTGKFVFEYCKEEFEEEEEYYDLLAMKEDRELQKEFAFYRNFWNGMDFS